jgi:hypothetical protein
MLLIITVFTWGCGIGGKRLVLQDVIEPLDVAVDQLAADWPKASGIIRGAIGEENLIQGILEDMDEIDSWFQDDDGCWLENVKLNTWQKWYIAGVRISHTGPVLRTLIQIYAPGLMVFPEVVSALAFLGMTI